MVIGQAINWAAGGNLIVFSRFASELWVMHADGTGRRRLALDRDYASLSPSGRIVAEIPHRHQYEDHSYLVLTTSARKHARTFRLPFGLSDVSGPPVWAPDERTLLLGATTGTFVADMRGRVRLFGRVYHTEWMVWSPDSRRIVFSGCVSSGCGLLVARRDGTKRTLLAELSVGASAFPTWSPDGRILAFMKLGPRPPGARAIYVVHPDGSGLRRVTTVRSSAVELAWSPDNRSLAFSGLKGIVIVDVRGGDKRRITPRRADDRIAWAPSQRILYTRVDRMYTVVPGSRPKPIRG